MEVYKYVFQDSNHWFNYILDLDDHLINFMFNNPDYDINYEISIERNNYNTEEFVVSLIVNKFKNRYEGEN